VGCGAASYGPAQDVGAMAYYVSATRRQHHGSRRPVFPATMVQVLLRRGIARLAHVLQRGAVRAKPTVGVW
jgi:hypothetical protein